MEQCLVLVVQQSLTLLSIRIECQEAKRSCGGNHRHAEGVRESILTRQSDILSLYTACFTKFYTGSQYTSEAFRYLNQLIGKDKQMGGSGP